MTSRQRVLDRIRAALADVPADESAEAAPAPPPSAGPAAAEGSADHGYRRSHAGPDPVGQLAERIADYRATVTRVTGADRARAAIGAALAERGVRQLVVPPGFPGELLPEGPWRVLGDEPPLSRAALDAADGVLSTAALGIAVTGTLVLDAGPGQGRRALTLLPDYHLCVVREEHVAGDLPEALGRLDPARPLTFVSGPSATSDIELERVEGVHGPRTLHVVIIAQPDAAVRSGR
ncbi:lactate utilization protein C [Streptacidiphilus sp. PB12-B1b]|uniref:LutC/YkgG family protein n=1 Tax=Streptacidiphilus sp. PB12-B1b TaxID=2705012 RepID=UPI0015F846E8|nr:LUD domain-containing protein [Streptacidiphilus sp. PB12-B1b]QMU77652.1 lactate utilization protein C [Streptacidiphilus sp. PB12-B1b]